jgi:hypothetical protein
MRHNQGSQPVGPVQALHQVENSIGILLIKVAGGLIGHKHDGIIHQRPRDGGPLLFPAGKLPRAVTRAGCQPDLIQPVIRPAERLAARDPAHQQRHSYVFSCREVRQEMMPLPDEPNGSVSNFRKRFL